MLRDHNTDHSESITYSGHTLSHSETTQLIVNGSEPIYYKIFTVVQSFCSGCIFTLLRPEALRSSLLARSLSVPKILGSNPGISGWKEEILGYVFILKRAHRAETDFTNIEWFPHRLLTGATTPPLSEEDPIRAPPASTSRPSYISSFKCPSDSNFPKKKRLWYYVFPS